MPDDPADSEDEAWRRRRRLAEVFGDTVPDSTTDDRDEGDRTDRNDVREGWLKSQVPPHHG